MRKTKELIKIIAPPALVMLFHITISFLNIYEFYPWADIPMHFLGGLAIAISFSIILKILQRKKHLGKMRNYLFFLFIISLVALTAVLWEFVEYTLDLALNSTYFQGSLTDTIWDLFFGLIGGIFGYLSKNNTPTQQSL